MIKNFFRSIHLILGLLSGLVVFTVATTGCITAFDEEIRASVYSDMMEVSPGSSPKISLDSIQKIAGAHYPKGALKNVRVKPEKTAAVEVSFRDKESVFVNPYTGKVTGSMNKETDFFGVILDLHRNLYLGETGEIITGCSALIFLFMIISGMILWWPGRKRLNKQKFTLAKKVNWRKKSYDLHRVFGFYASWIIIFTVLTGLIWSYDWAEDTMYWLTNSQKGKKMEVKSIGSKLENTNKLDQIHTLAIGMFPVHKECIINVPEDENDSYRIAFRYSDNGFYRKQDNLFFDQYSGKLLDKKLFSSLSTGDKFKMTNINIHTGRVFGLLGQLLVFFASLICASLPITGFLIWYGKRKKPKAAA